MASRSLIALLLALLMISCALLAEGYGYGGDDEEDEEEHEHEDHHHHHHHKHGGKGDPIMTAFNGRTFEFIGQVGGIYNVISEREHQVSMKLKLGQMWDHNGTYMEGIGFRYKDHKIIVELAYDDEMQVYLDGKRLHMAPEENEQEHILAMPSGELMLLWQLHRPDIGNAAEITTDLLSIVVYVTPAGTRDEGGVLQPAYLNFDASLLGPPAPGMNGIIGEGYDVMLVGGETAATKEWEFEGREEEFRMPAYFSTKHVHNAFGEAAAINPARRLAERGAIAFPLYFGGRSVPSNVSAPVAVKIGSRKALL